MNDHPPLTYPCQKSCTRRSFSVNFVPDCPKGLRLSKLGSDRLRRFDRLKIRVGTSASTGVNVDINTICDVLVVILSVLSIIKLNLRLVLIEVFILVPHFC